MADVRILASLSLACLSSLKYFAECKLIKMSLPIVETFTTGRDPVGHGP